MFLITSDSYGAKCPTLAVESALCRGTVEAWPMTAYQPGIHVVTTASPRLWFGDMVALSKLRLSESVTKYVVVLCCAMSYVVTKSVVPLLATVIFKNAKLEPLKGE